MGLLDGYVGGRLPKGVQPDYSGLESTLGGEHLTTKEDHDFYLGDYIAAVSKGTELHPELKNVKSVIQCKLDEIKNANQTEDSYNTALENLITANQNVAIGKSIKRSNANERPLLFKSFTRVHYIDENIVADKLGIGVKNASVVYSGSFSRFDLYEKSSKDLWRTAMDKYIFPQVAEESDSEQTEERSHNSAPEQTTAAISALEKINTFIKTSLSAEEQSSLNQRQPHN